MGVVPQGGHATTGSLEAATKDGLGIAAADGLGLAAADGLGLAAADGSGPAAAAGGAVITMTRAIQPIDLTTGPKRLVLRFRDDIVHLFGVWDADRMGRLRATIKGRKVESR